MRGTNSDADLVEKPVHPESDRKSPLPCVPRPVFAAHTVWLAIPPACF